MEYKCALTVWVTLYGSIHSRVKVPYAVRRKPCQCTVVYGRVPIGEKGEDVEHVEHVEQRV